MTQKTILEATANTIDTKLGKFIFYTALLAAPLAGSIAVYDTIHPDIDGAVTVESTAATNSYMDQITSFERLREEHSSIDKFMSEIRGIDTRAMEERQDRIASKLKTAMPDFERAVLTDTTLAEQDYKTISERYSSLDIITYGEELPSFTAGALEECQAYAFEKQTNTSEHKDRVLQCMLDEEPSGLHAMSIALPLMCYVLPLLNKSNISVQKRTTNFLRRKAKKISGLSSRH